MFTNEQLSVIAHCAKECSLQESGENSVSDMVNAWEVATTISPTARPFPKRLTIATIEHLGYLVEPEKNEMGVRIVPVTIGGILTGSYPEYIIRNLEMLLEAQYNLTPAEFYKEFEEIHPFVDGNGRVGDILYNYLSGTLDNPTLPPDFWKA
jgi:hypothetical protein